jgi:hypothetical protein
LLLKWINFLLFFSELENHILLFRSKSVIESNAGVNELISIKRLLQLVKFTQKRPKCFVKFL